MKEMEASKRKAIWNYAMIYKHQWAATIDPIATFVPFAGHTVHTWSTIAYTVYFSTPQSYDLRDGSKYTDKQTRK